MTPTLRGLSTAVDKTALDQSGLVVHRISTFNFHERSNVFKWAHRTIGGVGSPRRRVELLENACKSLNGAAVVGSCDHGIRAIPEDVKLGEIDIAIEVDKNLNFGGDGLSRTRKKKEEKKTLASVWGMSRYIAMGTQNVIEVSGDKRCDKLGREQRRCKRNVRTIKTDGRIGAQKPERQEEITFVNICWRRLNRCVLEHFEKVWCETGEHDFSGKLPGDDSLW
jgi:hypothetical protein